MPRPKGFAQSTKAVSSHRTPKKKVALTAPREDSRLHEERAEYSTSIARSADFTRSDEGYFGSIPARRSFGIVKKKVALTAPREDSRLHEERAEYSTSIARSADFTRSDEGYFGVLRLDGALVSSRSDFLSVQHPNRPATASKGLRPKYQSGVIRPAEFPRWRGRGS